MTDAAKAVVLARGLGTRMREEADAAGLDRAQADAAARGAKAMMPIAHGTSAHDASEHGDGPATARANAAARPFLDFVLTAVADAGYTDVCLVIGPEHDRLREYYTRDAPPRRLRVAFAIQPVPRGTADALLAAEAFAATDDVLVINGDNYYPAEALRALRELGEPGTALFEPDALVRLGNIAPGLWRAFAVGAVSAEGYLVDIIEKPDETTVRAMGGRPLVSMNCWRLPPVIFDACRAVQPSPRGELELTQAIRDAVRTRGLRLRVLRRAEGVLDLSRRTDIASVASRLRDLPVST